MSLVSKFIFAALSICLVACGNEENHTSTEETTTIPPAIGDTATSVLQSEALPDSTPPTAEISEEGPVRVGRHKLTLQWISWDRPGYANIEKADSGKYTIKGEQRNKNNEYLRISGILKPISDEYLEFKGRIETKVAQGNSGEPCIREGDMIFYAKGNRKYWRLQEMLNCDSVVTDYVDIYF